MVRSRPLLIALGVIVALGACGRKGPPVAPEQRLPRPASDVGAVVREGNIELHWTNPGRRVDGSRVRDLDVVRVFRFEDTGDAEPKPALLEKGRVRGYTEVATIRMSSPAPAVMRGDRATLDDRLGLAFGRRYTYTVVATDAEGRSSAPSARVSATFIAVPVEPRNVVVEPGERQALLRWDPPATLRDGTAVSGPLTYEILRATGPDAALAPVGHTTEPRFVDRDLENERTYTYAVRAVRDAGTTQAIGAATSPVSVTPIRTTPPAPPRDLVAIPSAGTVRLSWQPSPDPEVGRYVVYRATESGADATVRGADATVRGAFERVGSTTPPGTTFLDRDVPAGRYRYAVTAEDRSSRGNESGRSNEVSVSVP